MHTLTRMTRSLLILTTIMSSLFSIQAFAKDAFYTSYFSDTAVSGYDTVAYFRESKPVKGSAEFSTTYKGVNWNFKNQANLKTFQENPEKYMPQYGGYCAWAVSQGKTASADPSQWTIENGKLYLNYNRRGACKMGAGQTRLYYEGRPKLACID